MPMPTATIGAVADRSSPSDPSDPARVPGERPPARLPGSEPAQTLDRAPGERYAASAKAGATAAARGGGPSAARALVVPLVIAMVGGVVLTLFELLDLGAGLLAVGVVIGWLTGLAVRTTPRDVDWARTADRRSIVAAAVAVLGSALGFGLIWAWSRVAELGALGPLDYLAERFGPLPLLLLVLAAGAAALRAR
jgi:hypothetical protein